MSEDGDEKKSDLSQSLDINSVDSIFKDTEKYRIDFRCLTGSIIGIEGLIGVGKTTAGRSLVKFLKSNGFKAKFFKEKVPQELLKQYIGNMRRYAYTFQLIMQNIRLQIYKDAIKYSRKGGISIIDRTLTGDITFALMQYRGGNITREEWHTYNSIMKNSSTNAPSMILYFKAKPRITYERMIKRGNASEKSGYTLEYFENLHRTYEEVMGRLKANKKVSILDINWERELKVNSGLLKDKECIDLLYECRKIVISG